MEKKNNKKRNILLATLIPVGVLAATAAIVTPTVLVLNNKTVKFSSDICPSDMVIEKNLKLNAESTITVTIPEGKELDEDSIVILVGTTKLTKDTDFEVKDANSTTKYEIVIKAEAMKSTTVAFSCKYKSVTPTVTEKTLTWGLIDEEEKIYGYLTQETFSVKQGDTIKFTCQIDESEPNTSNDYAMTGFYLSNEDGTVVYGMDKYFSVNSITVGGNTCTQQSAEEKKSEPDAGHWTYVSDESIIFLNNKEAIGSKIEITLSFIQDIDDIQATIYHSWNGSSK